MKRNRLLLILGEQFRVDDVGECKEMARERHSSGRRTGVDMVHVEVLMDHGVVRE